MLLSLRCSSFRTKNPLEEFKFDSTGFATDVYAGVEQCEGELPGSITLRTGYPGIRGSEEQSGDLGDVAGSSGGVNPENVLFQKASDLDSEHSLYQYL